MGKISRRVCKCIFQGTIGAERTALQVEVVRYWEEKTVMRTECKVRELGWGTSDERISRLWFLDGPTTPNKVSIFCDALNSHSVSGLDGVGYNELSSCDTGELAFWYNCFLSRAHVPRCLNDSRVTLIPKKVGTRGSNWLPTNCDSEFGTTVFS